MRLLPREWDGLHPAFPKQNEQWDMHSPLVQTNILAGSIGGVFGVAWFIASKLSRRVPRGGILRGIGLLYTPTACYNLFSDEMQRRIVIKDIQDILQADGISLPPRRLFKRTSTTSIDDTSLAVGGVFAAATLLLASRAPFAGRIGYQSVIGAFGAGGFAVALRSLAFRIKQGSLEEDIKAGDIFRTKTGKEPPKWLYFDLSTRYRDEEGVISSGNLVMGPISPSGGMFLEGLTEDSSSQEVPILTPPGTDPHKSGYGRDANSKFIFPIRDYEWSPTSESNALEKLEDHLRELNQERTRYAQEAEYLWHIIARREARGYPVVRQGLETEAIMKERRMLELLTSIHKQLYEEVANLDWCIANTRKMMLQVRTEGRWLPNERIPENFNPKGLLNLIRDHKMKLEEVVANHQAMMDAVQAPEQTRNETRKELVANLNATSELLEDLATRNSGKDN